MQDRENNIPNSRVEAISLALPAPAAATKIADSQSQSPGLSSYMARLTRAVTNQGPIHPELPGSYRTRGQPSSTESCRRGRSDRGGTNLGLRLGLLGPGRPSRP